MSCPTASSKAVIAERSRTMERSLSLPADAPRMAPLGRLPLFAVVQLTLMGGLAWYF